MAVFRLMTLNLRLSWVDDGPNHWVHRWPHVKDLIQTWQPTIFGAQECMPNQLVNIMGELPGYFAYPGPDTMMAKFSLRNPLFVCQSCKLPRAEGALALNDSGVIGQVGWDGMEPRLAHLLRFDGWTLVNAHFEAWDCDTARLESARLLVKHLQEEPAVVVMGDLNCPPDSAPIRVFQEAGYKLAKDSLPLEVDRRTFHNFNGQGLVEVDYVLVRGGAVRDVQIPRPRSQTPFLSDHDPLVADIEIGP